VTVRVFGIRHHGPGSARSLLRALESWCPDAVLVEGPPEAEPLLPLIVHEQMHPPVALLLYRPDQPQRAAYYPFAHFSPEWQALCYARRQDLPARFIDLPQGCQLGETPPLPDPVPAGGGESGAEGDLGSPPPAETGAPAPSDPNPHLDPLGWLAQAAGDADGEQGWERMVEQRRDSSEVFAAVLEAMTALRAELPVRDDPAEAKREALREAQMRQQIRGADREGFARIAVVCGAWHAPVLAEPGPAKADAALLAGLPKVKVAATWVPWTDELLTRASGYGAGVTSPGWYGHLWSAPDHLAERWLAQVAGLLRAEDLDASSAQVIEAVRLAQALAALRDRTQVGLPELTEATQAVLCHGDDLPLRLIERKLIVGERLGQVPDETPMVPLQQDLLREQKRLRLRPEAVERQLNLDLRQPTDLARSHLLHRLSLLGVAWGEPRRASGARGTFHELWRLQWRPELTVALIAAGVFGNTIGVAAAACARDRATSAASLPELTALVDRALLADLPTAVAAIMARLQNSLAETTDLKYLMDALPALTRVLRYGNVRQTDASQVAGVVDGLVARLCIGLPVACASLDDEAAAAMFERLQATDSAIALLRQPEHLAAWRAALRKLIDQQGLHGLLAGRAVRLLLDAGACPPDEAARRLGLALSRAGDPAQMAAWVEGFLKGSGLILLHDETLWSILDAWLTQLPADSFTLALPLLRRTFATFSASERRQMGERARAGQTNPRNGPISTADFDTDRADGVLPLLRQLLGIPG
jgi:hypothetical protein